MITKITLNGVASYKKKATLETDKKVNLIYGLNGTGKSTFSNYLYDLKNENFKGCSIEGIDNDTAVLVYNQKFIHENFFEPENLKGIFTLSKENKEAETKISIAEIEIKRIVAEKILRDKELDDANKLLVAKSEAAKDKVWEIKKNYTGGDRLIEFCLEGYKSDGNKLLAFIESLVKPSNSPEKSISELKQEVHDLSGENAQKYDLLEEIYFEAFYIENEPTFEKQIVGNSNSSVSALINKLGSSDWVKAGLRYLKTPESENTTECPFCQESTISTELVNSIKDYFDETYETDISRIKEYLNEYDSLIRLIPDKSKFENHPKIDTLKKDFEIKFNKLIKVTSDNKKLIEDKIKFPSLPIQLTNSKNILEDLNLIIQKVNTLTEEHNNKIENKIDSLEQIKKMFWKIMRWDYDQTLSALAIDKQAINLNISKLKKSIETLNADYSNQLAIIAEQQKETINIEEAISNINIGLIDLGIESFKIRNHSENLYRIVRGDSEDKIFQSLSEGEKMIISFLYFIELCRGKNDVTETARKKVIVIDDPISSLSHVYVFNIGRLIKKEFLGVKEKKGVETTWKYNYEQIFILTHSLYFFYEITETKHDERKETQKLFRITKNQTGSEFSKMSYEEIQNDYQAYWYIIKDKNQPPTLIANCMRNIIEYFFNFVEKQDLNNFFLQESMTEIRFQSFYRYINRESHSLGQNIFDYKEFNYDDFKDAFASLFKVAGYEAHYNKMIK